MSHDFETDSMRYRATEYMAAAYYDHRAVYGTAPSIAEQAPPLIRYIARRMALVATPYWPCTDLDRH